MRPTKVRFAFFGFAFKPGVSATLAKGKPNGFPKAALGAWLCQGAAPPS
jgi:hypothetical protein